MSITNHYCRLDIGGPLVSGETFYVIDDENGHIPCVLQEFSNGEKYLVVAIGQGPSSYVGRKLNFKVVEYKYSPSLDLWTKVITGRYKENDTMYVDDTTYVYQATGVNEDHPYENDLDSPIYGPTPEVGEGEDPIEPEIIGYNQKLKVGLVTEYQYYFMTLGKHYIFPTIQQAVATRMNDEV